MLSKNGPEKKFTFKIDLTGYVEGSRSYRSKKNTLSLDCDSLRNLREKILLKQDLGKNKEFLDKLKAECPLVFKELNYLETGIGWNRLVEMTSKVIQHELERLPEELREQIYAVQIKQKFAGLRYYMNHDTPFIDGVIALAETMSYHTCEDCGAPAKGRTIGGWMTTLCDKHYKVAMKAVEKQEREWQKSKTKKSAKP